MARPNPVQLADELDEALEGLNELRPDGTARASLAHAVAMIRVWSLRFQLAQTDLESAWQDETPAHAVARARQDTKDASGQIEVWEKRASTARADRVNDLLLEEQRHNEEQVALAKRAQALQ